MLGLFSIFTGFFGRFKFIFIGIVIISVLSGITYFYIKYNKMINTIENQRNKIVLYEKQLNDLKQINDENKRKFKELNKNYQRNIELLNYKYKKALKRVKVVTKIRERIKYIRINDSSKDGDVAPVLKDTLDAIRKKQ